jgi:superfamily II helicase
VHLGWRATDAAAVVQRAEQHGLVRRDGDLLKLTDSGRGRARTILGSARG